MSYWRFNSERLREARTARGWSLAELARRSGLRPPALSAIETRRDPCRERSARAIAAALELPLQDVAAPYKRSQPRQLPVETWPTAEDFRRLEEQCAVVGAFGFHLAEKAGAAASDDEVSAFLMADAKVLVRLFADARTRGVVPAIVDFTALHDYQGAEWHSASTRLTPDRRRALVDIFCGFNLDVGTLSHEPGVRAAAVAVADWLGGH
ncbi:helix-turn-helix domain-containing protein [Streptomyces hyaluromycini]|uniref:helix-turn-helix domain-containing protein n=1 Tax=Streptomyces hyaluromycini TaxID=1377993 RepID=UPI000B5C8EF7|nr:helix-turn-helix domain-containing protein [Streptomyces hyaluromycini]